MTAALDRLHKKIRGFAEEQLAGGEEVITVIPGRSRQAMVVTDRRILVLKPGILAGRGLGTKATSFTLNTITGVNVHTGRGLAALELVIAGTPRPEKPDLTSAYQLPNWLPAPVSLGSSPMIRELRAYVESDGRSRSARAELSAFDGG